MRIAIINLDISVDRLKKCSEQLSNYGHDFERISAVDIRVNENAGLIETYSVRQNYFGYYKTLKPGEIGCYLSHRKLWQKMVDEDIDQMLVLEDDFELKADLHNVLEFVSSINPSDWDIIKLGEIPKKRIKKILQSKGELQLISFKKAPQGTYAYIISKKAARQMLAFSSPFFRPIDVDMQHFWEHKQKVLGILNNPFIHIDGESVLKTMGNRDKTKRRLFVKFYTTFYEKLMLLFGSST